MYRSTLPRFSWQKPGPRPTARPLARVGISGSADGVPTVYIEPVLVLDIGRLAIRGGGRMANQVGIFVITALPVLVAQISLRRERLSPVGLAFSAGVRFQQGPSPNKTHEAAYGRPQPSRASIGDNRFFHHRNSIRSARKANQRSRKDGREDRIGRYMLAKIAQAVHQDRRQSKYKAIGRRADWEVGNVYGTPPVDADDAPEYNESHQPCNAGLLQDLRRYSFSAWVASSGTTDRANIGYTTSCVPKPVPSSGNCVQAAVMSLMICRTALRPTQITEGG